MGTGRLFPEIVLRLKYIVTLENNLAIIRHRIPDYNRLTVTSLSIGYDPEIL